MLRWNGIQSYPVFPICIKDLTIDGDDTDDEKKKYTIPKRKQRIGKSARLSTCLM